MHAALILLSVGLVWLAHLRRPVTTIAIIAATTIALSIGTFTIAVNAATHSYCQPGSVVSDMTGATADYC